MSQSREEITTTVYFFQHFTTPIFSPVFHVSLFFPAFVSLTVCGPYGLLPGLLGP